MTDEEGLDLLHKQMEFLAARLPCSVMISY